MNPASAPAHRSAPPINKSVVEPVDPARRRMAEEFPGNGVEVGEPASANQYRRHGDLKGACGSRGGGRRPAHGIALFLECRLNEWFVLNVPAVGTAQSGTPGATGSAGRKAAAFTGPTVARGRTCPSSPPRRS